MMTNIEKCFADVKEEIAAAIKELMQMESMTDIWMFS